MYRRCCARGGGGGVTHEIMIKVAASRRRLRRKGAVVRSGPLGGLCAHSHTSRRGSGPGAYGEYTKELAMGSSMCSVKAIAPAVIWSITQQERRGEEGTAKECNLSTCVP